MGWWTSVGWFQHSEAEFTLAHIPANSYVCYIHVIQAMPSKVLTVVRDLTREITVASSDPYLQNKEAFLSCFTASPLYQCFKLLHLPPLSDRRPSALFVEMQAQLPRDNLLFNATFLRCLPESMSTALADRGEWIPGDLGAAADLLQHTTPTLAASVAAAPALGYTSPIPVNANPNCYTPSPRRPNVEYKRMVLELTHGLFIT